MTSHRETGSREPDRRAPDSGAAQTRAAETGRSPHPDDAARTEINAPATNTTGIDTDGHRTLLKWHRARRRPEDTAFTAERIAEAMRAGAAVEIDLRVHADRGFVVLHDATLDDATTGSGAVAETTAAELARLHLRDEHRRPTRSPVLLLDDLAALASSAAPNALLQLDFKQDATALDEVALAAFAEAVTPFAAHAILSCGDPEAVALLTESVPGLHVGYDPCHGGAMERALGDGDFEGFVAQACTASPRAEMVYLHHRLVVGAADRGYDLVAAFHRTGRRVDAYTVGRADDQDLPLMRRLLELRADQITTDDAQGWVALLG